MKIRLIAKLKNENFRELRIAAGFLTMTALSKETGINAVTLGRYENFKDYPDPEKGRVRRHIKRAKQIIQILERTFKRPVDDFFPDDYKFAVDQKMGHSFEIVKEGNLLPEWAAPKELPSPEDIVEQRELSEGIEEAMNSLTEREAKLLKMRFGLGDGNDHTLTEVGEQFKITRSRASQIEAKAIRKLRHPSRNKPLRGFINYDKYWEERTGQKGNLDGN